ncbi:MAG: DUF418 domain-containing protein [Prevotellaceae bacterium]|nr:DUF418 domain-containing protein [Prevotellaceae bacterium]
MNNALAPTTDKQRYIILDAMRGLALLGICLANFPEFGLWTFLSHEAQEAMSTAQADNVVHFLQYLFVDAKFYSIFSILFGIGFSIILNHAEERGSSGIRLFYRRMFTLLGIGILHLLLLWSGDILALYAVTGMLLPLVKNLNNRRLLTLAAVCLSLPVLLDAWQEWAGVSIASAVESAWWAKAHSYGITEENFASWLRDADGYHAVHQFLIQGAIERLYEFVDGHRLLKVLGLFIIGYVIGRNRLYARLAENKSSISKTFVISLAIGLPSSILYAISATSGHLWGQPVHSILYALSAYPTALAYITAFCLFYLRRPKSLLFNLLSKPGRMALTNYLLQSILGIAIYYGIGFGLGLSMGLWQIELTAFAVFLFQILFSHFWMRYIRYGLVEWFWRMLTYCRWLNPVR